MTEVAPVPAAPAKSSTKKKTASKPKAPGPSTTELILEIVAASKERNGVSMAALKKNLASKGYDIEKNKGRLKTLIKNMVAKEVLVQTKGTGASGSFKMNKKSDAKTPRAKAPAKAKQSPAKPKKAAAAAKKTVASKKPKTTAAKATVKKAAKKSLSPKKTKKPVKSTKKAGTPKKAPAAKKPAPAKKAPAKKASKPKTVKKAAAKKK